MPTEKNIKTPEELYIHFESYKTEAKNNPYLKHVFVGKDGNSKYQELEKPLTWNGFEYMAKKERNNIKA